MDVIELNCVFWGTKFSEDYVYNLKAMVERNTTVPHKFVCYSDRELEGIETRKLPEGLHGWWNKIHLFNSDLRSEDANVIFMDLDTMIVNDIDWLMNYKGQFAIMDKGLIDTNNQKETGHFASGIFAFNSKSNKYIWDRFLQHQHVIRELHGDQDFLTYAIDRKLGVNCIQRMGGVASWKFNHIHKIEDPANLPSDLSIVCFHGIPMPHEAIDNTVSEYGNTYEARKWIADYWRL